MNAKSPTIDIWKPISMLNNRVSDKTYYASQLGNIRIINHNRNTEHIINKFNITSAGYARVTFYINRKVKNFYVHILVANAWIPNPKKLPYINHKNEIKSDNRIDNLERCTVLYNNTYNDRHIKVGKLGRKRVFKYDLKGDIIEEYNSLTECAKITGYAISTISNCCNHYKFCVGNYIYLHEYDNFNDHVNKFKS